ncbi:MAG: hypothetical protein AB6733_20665 [Clostridiaceae bacterium]
MNINQSKTLNYYFETGRSVAGISTLILAGLLLPLALSMGITVVVFNQAIDTLDYTIDRGNISYG